MPYIVFLRLNVKRIIFTDHQNLIFDKVNKGTLLSKQSRRKKQTKYLLIFSMFNFFSLSFYVSPEA